MSEYIKKEDLFNKTIKRNSIWNGTTNAEGKGLEEIVNDLPTYSFPDSAENKARTNGGAIISLYPDLKYTIRNGRVITTIGVAASFDLEWWNLPYKAESEVSKYVL